MIERMQPDIAIVDITLRGVCGLELIKELRASNAKVRAIVLSMHDESMYAERALKAGACGYVAKHEAASKLMEAVDCVMAGKLFFSARITAQMVRTFFSSVQAAERSERGPLSEREKEIFRLIGKGLTTKDIARVLQLGEKTVHSHRFHIKFKLRIKHSADLYNQAARWIEDQGSTDEPI
jgi:DNA-binding NarL/FixJ family response regulator